MILLAWLHRRLGYHDTRELLRDMAQSDEGFDADGRSHACTRLLSRAERLNGIGPEDLVRYEATSAARWRR